jgi:hypothetical protein
MTRDQLNDLSQERLDDMVQQLKLEEAARINNDGRVAQIEYILAPRQ